MGIRPPPPKILVFFRPRPSTHRPKHAIAATRNWWPAGSTCGRGNLERARQQTGLTTVLKPSKLRRPCGMLQHKGILDSRAALVDPSFGILKKVPFITHGQGSKAVQSSYVGLHFTYIPSLVSASILVQILYNFQPAKQRDTGFGILLQGPRQFRSLKSVQGEARHGGIC